MRSNTLTELCLGSGKSPKRSWSDSPDQSDRKIIIQYDWYMYRISVHFSVYFPLWLHPFFIHACARSPQRAITYARQTIEKKTVFVVRQAKARPKRRRSGAVSPVGSEMCGMTRSIRFIIIVTGATPRRAAQALKRTLSQ